MSGGVDSAVALLRAGPERRRRHAAALARSGGPGLGARLLLARRGDRGAPDLPLARPAARDARPARGVPARGRRAVRPRLRARRDAEPVHALQRHLPLRASCSRSRGASAPRGSRRATTRGSSSTAGACCSRAARPARRTSRTCSPRLDPARLERVWFPLGEQGKDETRAEAARAGLAVAARAESQEACFLAGDDYRDFLERHGAGADARARSSTRTGRELGRHEGAWRFTPGQRKGVGVAAGRAALRARAPSRAPTRSSSARASRSRGGACRPAAGSTSPVERAEAKLRYRSPGVPARVHAARARLPPRARRARVRRRRRAGRRALRGRRRRRVRPGDLRPRRIRSWRDARHDLHLERPRVSRAERLPPRARARGRLRALAARRHVPAALVADRRHRARGAAGGREGRAARSTASTPSSTRST